MHKRSCQGKMIGDRSHVLMLTLLLVLTVGTVVALVCEPPVDSKFCSNIRIKCLAYEEQNCTASGGEYIDHGGLCNACNLCVKYVGAGENCNATVVEYGAVEGGVAVWSVCQQPYVCSRQNNGTCVRPEECEYPPTTTETPHDHTSD